MVEVLVSLVLRERQVKSRLRVVRATGVRVSSFIVEWMTVKV